MLKLAFTDIGYIYMLLIWLIAPSIAIYHARKKKLNPFFWGALCFVIPLALFVVVGIRAPGEPVPRLFRDQVKPEKLYNTPMPDVDGVERLPHEMIGRRQGENADAQMGDAAPNK